jgi:predicted ATPase
LTARRVPCPPRFWRDDARHGWSWYAAFGVEGVAARLDDRFRLLTGGNRTGLPRHQTLRATLDWSYELLAESERVVLRRAAVFAGAFTLEAASVVAASVDIGMLLRRRT